MKKIILLVLITNISLQSQDLLYVPDFFNKQVESKIIQDIYKSNTVLENYSSAGNSKSFWVVYSDRDNNKLKVSANGSNNGTELTFKQPLFVKEVDDNWLLVCSVLDDNEDLGWINASNLILSRYSLMTNSNIKNNKFSVPRKGVILNNINAQSFGENIENNKKYYSNPNKNEALNVTFPKKFQTLFIFKETEKSFLLASTDYLSGTPSTSIMKLNGWIDKVFVRNWDTRVALEPARTELSMNEYSGVTLRGYEYEKDLLSCVDKSFCKDIFITKFKCEPIRNNVMRKPVIESDVNDNPNIKKVICLTNDTELNPLYEQKLLDATKLSEKMNIVFVLDATKSMKPYYKSISKSLQKVIDYNKKIIEADVEMGVIIYRDYADGDNQYNFLPLTNDINKVKTFINNTECISKDNDLAEAQFNGLINGLPRMGFKKNESNVIVLIGDCGNHQNDEKGNSLTEVINLVDKHNLNIISFQVNSTLDDSYFDYNDDIETMMLESSNMKVKRNNSKLKIKFQYQNGNKIKLDMSGGEEKSFENKFGVLVFADGEPIKPRVLENTITETLADYTESVLSNILTLNSLIITGPGGEALTEGVIIKLQELLKISRQEVINWANKNELTTEAYVAIDYNGNGIPSQIPVVFLTEKEKKRLVRSLKMMINEVNGSAETKEVFKENVILVCKSIIGQGITTNVIENLTFNQIWNIILGVDFENKKMKNSILKDFTTDISRSVFNEFYSDFESKAKIFCSKSYTNSDNKKSRRFTLAGSYLYWIPLSDLPGCGE